MSARKGLLRNRWVSAGNSSIQGGVEQHRFFDLLERYPPTFDEWDAAVFSVASSEHSPCKEHHRLWDMYFDEFEKILDWVQMCEAREFAANKDANQPTR